jgi:predicted nucleotidyltransferase
VEEAYLVGSRARGDWTPSSDFDVAVVVGDDVDPVDVATRVRLLRGSIPLDVVEIRRGELGDPVYAGMLKYARGLR